MGATCDPVTRLYSLALFYEVDQRLLIKGLGVFNTLAPIMVENSQHGDLMLLGHPSGQGAGDGARSCDRKVPEDLRADSLATVLSTPQTIL
ncbi:hypothetical protein PoB_006426500 [Plakobranchus ocellatus]|uniref:Uncharacterized protein n=1 Tax=Plakobranchus ocellatus TaxID=259542 RepID=A0AAV4D108_9GAST|nr:hypothetical protein PoB_006426500 [Plakobranchus ocellatus]